ncbi:cationic amino acid transporter 3-like isoform X2 [Neocloeon triangulifer]|uniref:cationic amino acid transporter 3-like isoform X2 n=1 Tax=Neocloeon triangulifer TaxID=2078957 RepID=UPI00286F8A2F|nr:cationic amino acid transporter 3-like isoform X2 [Neocloeon triangulifer]
MGICRKMFRPREPTKVEPPVQGLRGLYLADLISDSIGGPLGLAVFVLLGYVARLAGPAVIISVVFAAVVAIIAGACYAELGSSTPRTGSTAALALNLGRVGELVAFLVTWNLIADLAIGTAAAAKGVRASIDAMTNNALTQYFTEVAPLESEYTSPFVDFLALPLPIICIITCCVFREYMMPRVAGTLFAVVIFLYMVIAGAFEADSSLWSIPANCTGNTCPPGLAAIIGDGYFLPYGMWNVFQGAAILSIAFIDLGKGAYPIRGLVSKKQILPPLSSMVAFAIGFVFLFSIGIIVTMMRAYFMLIPAQEVITVFKLLSYREGLYIVATGAILVLLFTIETFAYTIAGELNALVKERALFPFLGNVDVYGRERPLYGALVIGLISGLLGAFFTEGQLAQMLSIGTLISFGLIMCSSIINRCQYDAWKNETGSFASVVKQFLMCRRLEAPNFATSNAAKIATVLYSLLCLGLGGLIVYFSAEIGFGYVGAVIALIVLSVLALYVLTIITLQPQNTSTPIYFKVPLFPLFQGLGILFAAFLIMNVHAWAWYRLALWSAIGLILYVANFCFKSSDPESNDKSKRSSGSDVAALVGSKSSISVQSETKSTKEIILTGGAVMREKSERKTDDSRRNGWLEAEENEVKIELVDTLSLTSESVSGNSSATAEQQIVEVAVPDIVVSEILKTADDVGTPTSSRHEDTPEFYARQLDEMFTFDTPGDTDSHYSSGESVVEVHQPPKVLVDEDTGEVSREESRSVRFAHTDDESSSDEESNNEKDENKLHVEAGEDEVVVAPSSPKPPPLPPANLVISAHLSSKSRPVEVEDVVVPQSPTTSFIPEEFFEEKTTSHLNDFQLELRNTLKLRSQKLIDSIDNTVVNVNEGIEIFGGRRSREVSISEPVILPPPVTMKGGKFENHAFVEKLDSILKEQISGVENKRPRAKVYKQQKRVVILQELEGGESSAPMRFSSADLLSAKSKLRSSNGESSSLGDLNNNSNKLAEKAPSRREAKSLEAFESNPMIIEDK